MISVVETFLIIGLTWNTCGPTLYIALIYVVLGFGIGITSVISKDIFTIVGFVCFNGYDLIQSESDPLIVLESI